MANVHYLRSINNIIDCRMPVMDGWVATKMIRAHEAEAKSKRVYIVALTADDGGQEAAIRAGMCVVDFFFSIRKKERKISNMCHK